MQTMTALLRIAGSLEMTVRVHNVTPAEALLLMHVHDPATKDAFEDAEITGEVERSKTDERSRLQDKYPQHGKLIAQLFPGRNAADVPDAFSELQDVPLDLAKAGRRQRARAAHDAEVAEAPAAPAPYAGRKRAEEKPPPSDADAVRELVGSKK